ncbi:15691_t:CDS:1, partial [Gigaspora margarita]
MVSLNFIKRNIATITNTVNGINLNYNQKIKDPHNYSDSLAIKGVSCSVQYINDSYRNNSHNYEIEFWKTYNSHNSCDENFVSSNFGKGRHLFVSTKNYSTNYNKHLSENIRYNYTYLNLTNNIGYYERITGHTHDYYQMLVENISKNASDLYSNDRVPAFVILNITLNDTLFLNNSPLSYIGIYFEQVVLKDEELLFNVNNFYPILPGQYIIFEFSIIIVKKYSSYFMGQLGFESDRTDALLNIETK